MPRSQAPKPLRIVLRRRTLGRLRRLETPGLPPLLSMPSYPPIIGSILSDPWPPHPLSQTPARTPRLRGLSCESPARPTVYPFHLPASVGIRSSRSCATPAVARAECSRRRSRRAASLTASSWRSRSAAAPRWYRNLIAAGGGVIRWRGVDHPVGAPEPVDAQTALATFLPVQRAGLRAADIDGYIRLPDVPATPSVAGR